MSTPNEKVDGKPAPFRRVASQPVEVDPRLKDNSFDAKVNAPKFEKPRQLYVMPNLGYVRQRLHRPVAYCKILGIYL